MDVMERPSTALASLEAVPKILSIQEVKGTRPSSSPAGTTPRFADTADTPPSPGSPEVGRVNSAKRLGDEIVALETAEGRATAEPDQVAFLSEFDPFAEVGTDPDAVKDVDFAAELFAAFEAKVPGRQVAGTWHSVESEHRERRLVAELVPETVATEWEDEALPPVPEVQQVLERPGRLAAELREVQQAPQEAAVSPPRGRRLVAELDVRQVLSPDLGSPQHLQPLPDGCELEAPSLEAPRCLWEERSHRRTRSLDASVREMALDLRRSIPEISAVRPLEAPSGAQLRSRSVEHIRSPKNAESATALQRCFPMPEADLPGAVQVWEQPGLFSPPREVLQGFHRLMQQGDLLLLDAPGQAYLKYCEANSRHEEITGSKSGDAFHGMARSLSMAAERVCFERGLPGSREERLDLSLAMLESAIQHRCQNLGQARSDPTLQNLRLSRPERFAALMEHVPATGLDALAMTASAGMQELAAVAGIQPLSLVPTPPLPALPTPPTMPAVPPAAPPGAPPVMDALQPLEAVELFDDVLEVDQASDASDSGSEEGESSEEDGSDAGSDVGSDPGSDAGSDAGSERGSDRGSGSEGSETDEEATPKGAWASLVALFGW